MVGYLQVGNNYQPLRSAVGLAKDGLSIDSLSTSRHGDISIEESRPAASETGDDGQDHKGNFVQNDNLPLTIEAEIKMEDRSLSSGSMNIENHKPIQFLEKK